MNADSVIKKAILTYGENRQILKAVEELAELSAALLHYKERKDQASLHNVIEEIADVEIMTAQLRIIFNSTDIDIAKVKKLDRLEKRLQKE
jgi:NTP pyrophosphatase (non-canonical NTP hydrolase)